MAGWQVTKKVLFARLVIVTYSLVIAIISIIRFLFHIPSHILTAKRRRQATPPPPKVRTFVHEPYPTQTPRDTLLFIHGFPDCADMFNPQVQVLVKQGYRCIVVDTPGSRGEPVTSALSPEQVVDLLYSALKEKHNGPVTVVAHDWGAIYAILLHEYHPQVVRRMVLIDVGKFQGLHITEALAIGTYQTLFAFLYLLGDPVGTAGVHSFMKRMNYDVRPMKEVSADMCFAYCAVFRNPKLLKYLATGNLRADANTVPHLFVYGSKKAIRFHDDRWLEFVRQTPCGEVVQLTCDHWVSVRKADEFNGILEKWLERSEVAGRQESHGK